MKKTILKLSVAMMICASALGIGGNVGALEFERVEEDYAVRWDTDQKFLVTEINPGEGALTMVYTDVENTGQRITNLNVVWELQDGMGDALVSELGDGYFDWAQTVYNYDFHGTAFFVSGYEQMVGAPERDLRDNTSGVLYYYAMVDDGFGDAIYGRVDYSMCLNSDLYTDGVSCRLEKTVEGGLTYYPYYNNERLEKIETETEEPIESEVSAEKTEVIEVTEQTVMPIQDTQVNTKSLGVVQSDNGNNEKAIARFVANTDVDDASGAMDVVSETDDREHKDESMAVPELGGKEENRVSWWSFVVIGVVVVMIAGLAFVVLKHKGQKERI